MTVVGLGQNLATGLVSVPFRRPWTGERGVVDNLGTNVTRQMMRTFMGYATSLPTEEFRSLEVVLDDLCRVVMPPVARALDVTMTVGEVGGVTGDWYRPRGRTPRGTIVYLHGGGYIGTSPTMYAAFNAYLARGTGCELFTADYRLAPEFPYPAGLDDVAGDSGGGGLATSLVLDERAAHLPAPAGVILISPEVDLTLDEASISENAGRDILPWNIPVTPYLHGTDPRDQLVSAVNADLTGFPPTFVTFGDDEMFRDPIRRFVRRLGAAGVDREVIEAPGMFHVYPFLMPWAAPSRRVFHEIRRFVDRLLPAEDVGAVPQTRSRRAQA
jgi:monoterpene epsilon-lactone hydrolase